MTNRNTISLFMLLLFLSLFLQTCAYKPVTTPPVIDQYGCTVPPPDVLTSVGVDLQLAELKYEEFVAGGINVKTNPEIFTMASKAVTDDRIRSYLRCLAIKRDKYTKEQAAYVDTLSAFMLTNPSPENFISWQERNPFPPSTNPGIIQQHSYEHQGDVYNITGPVTIHDDRESLKNNLREAKKIRTVDDTETLTINDYSGNSITLREGESHTTKAANGAQVNYMLINNLIHVEYISKDGETDAYYILDNEGNVKEMKLPFKLEDYEVIVPDNLILVRQKTTLPNGHIKIHFKLKWGRTVVVIRDQNQNLIRFIAEGGKGRTTISNKKKTITVKAPNPE